MEPIPSSAERSVRRSRHRERILLMISSLGEAYLGQISNATGISVTRVRWVLHGHMPQYSERLALVPLGLVEERATPQGRVYVITPRGRRKARSVAARKARRYAWRALARGPSVAPGATSAGETAAAFEGGLVTSQVTWVVEYRWPVTCAAPRSPQTAPPPCPRPMRVYLAVPVRGAAPPEGSVAALREAVEGFGHTLVNEPGAAPPSAVVAQADSRHFIQEVDRMLEADLLVAEVSAPSHDVGWAVAWFLAKGRLAVLCCRRDARERLSPLLGGNPSPWQKIVVYDAAEDLASKLGALLKR